MKARRNVSRRHTGSLILVCWITWFCGSLAMASEIMPVERLDLQAKLLKAVMKFSTRQLEQMVVGIIYVEETRGIAQKFAEELERLTFNRHSITTALIASAQLRTLDKSINVVYVTPGNNRFLEAIFDMTSQKHIFSCTGLPEYVRNGHIALSFDDDHGTPQILLNLQVAKKTEHDFKNPKFLNLQAVRKLVLIK